MLIEPETPEFKAVVSAIERLDAHGFQTMVVGGAVRDLLIGKTPDDFDLVSVATPEELAVVFPGSVRMVGASFGVSLLKWEDTIFEIATAREERCYLDGRHPEQIRYSRDLHIDVLRRDFTINAIMYDPLNHRIVDYVDGCADLEKGIVRCVGESERRFREDYLRMLRAVRFAGRYGFSLDSSTREALDKLSHLAAGLSGERIREELSKILLSPRAADSFRLMFECGLLAAVLPEAAALSGVEQPPQFHPEGDVFEHTMLMLEKMVLPTQNLAWSVLLHDVGKPQCFSRDETGRIRFFGHEHVGAKIAEDILKRLHFSVVDRESIVNGIKNHMRFASVKNMKTPKVRRLLAGENFAMELELHRLDCISCHGMMDGFVFLLDQLRRQDDFTLPAPLVMGKDLIAAGFSPSNKFGKVLKVVYEQQLSGNVSDKEDALRQAVEMLRKSTN